MQFGSVNDSAAVKAQYATSKGLDLRIAFHDMYSTNRQGFGNWLVSQYEIREGMKVLEVGCGTGSMWIGHDDILSRCGRVVLADLSEGMIEKAKANLGERDNVEYRTEDIQNLTFADDTFDAVIANAMLYHVPDLAQGLREVRRVLKDGGVFYCSTMGENNFSDVLAEWFKLGGEEFHPNHEFTLQNGGAKLRKEFADVKALVYEDSLHITEPENLIEYLRSLISFKAILDIPVPQIRKILEGHVENGAIDLPKEYGTFVCR
ncbi:MAG: class I SAM-dependent methyltransferase [Lachnospiraceae bacterium]|nr:class I SAM-dependent methyltransferase [Lachnospiraceae bacterium]